MNLSQDNVHKSKLELQNIAFPDNTVKFRLIVASNHLLSKEQISELEEQLNLSKRVSLLGYGIKSKPIKIKPVKEPVIKLVKQKVPKEPKPKKEKKNEEKTLSQDQPKKSKVVLH